MSAIQIFGAGQTAQAIIDTVKSEGLFEISSICVDNVETAPPCYSGVPIVPLADADPSIPMFIGIGFNDLNHDRHAVYQRLKADGFSFASIISSNAIVRDTASVEENSLVLELNNIQAGAKIGKNTIVWSGNHIGHHTHVGSHCYISSHCVISGAVNIGDFTFIGVNATIGDNIKIGKGCIIGQGAIVGKDIPDYSIVKAEDSSFFIKNERTNRRVLRR
jgi:sugar O-acyltransferase (sialic acid O-acetyltransferase NeuD family)